jgi:hypothetical protein
MNLLPHFLFGLGDSSCTGGKIFGTGLYDKLCESGSVHITALTDIYQLIGNVIKILLSFVGLLSVIFIVIGGIAYILSTGDPKRIQRAKSIITNAIIGLIIALVSFAAVTFISGAIG